MGFKARSRNPGDVLPPTLPTNVLATVTGAGVVTVTWDASTDISGVKEYRVARIGGSTQTIPNTAPRTASFSGLAANTSYTFTVQAVDNVGNVSSIVSTAPILISSGMVWTIPDGYRIDMTQGGSYPIDQYVSVPQGINETYALLSGPTGMAIEAATGLLTVTGAVAATADGFEYDALIEVDDNVVVAGSLATIAVSGTGPWTTGHGFPPAAAADITSTSSVQVDVKNRWADGSVKFAIISGRDTGSIVLKAGSQGGGTPVSIADVLGTSFDATVNLDVGGTVYSASARTLLQGTVQKWLEGPLVTEWVVRDAAKNNGTPHPHLAVQFCIRAFKSLTGIDKIKVDAIIENGVNLTAGCNATLMTATVVVPGQTTYSWAGTQGVRTRWHRVMWWGGAPTSYARLDVDYLQGSKLVPKFMKTWKGVAITPTDTFLDAVAKTSTPMTLHPDGPVAAWQPPSSHQESGQRQIGCFPAWDSVYLINTDKRAYDYMLSANDTFGGAMNHYRGASGDPATSQEYPDQYDYPASGTPNGAIMGFEDSHAPVVGYTAYLASGDFFYLEECQFYAAWASLRQQPDHRDHGDGISITYYGATYDGNTFLGNQIRPQQARGQAWLLRNFGQAASASPDGSSIKTKLSTILGKNLTRHRYLWHMEASNPPSVSDIWYNELGACAGYDGNDNTNGFPFWMDNFVTWVYGHLYELGFDTLQALRFKGKFPVGIAGDQTGFCIRFAPEFHHVVGPAYRTWYTTFAEVFAACSSTFAYPAITTCAPAEGFWSENYDNYSFGRRYPHRAALVAAVAGGVTGATTALARLDAVPLFTPMSPAAPFGNQPNYLVDVR